MMEEAKKLRAQAQEKHQECNQIAYNVAISMAIKAAYTKQFDYKLYKDGDKPQQKPQETKPQEQKKAAEPKKEEAKKEEATKPKEEKKAEAAKPAAASSGGAGKIEDGVVIAAPEGAKPQSGADFYAGFEAFPKAPKTDYSLQKYEFDEGKKLLKHHLLNGQRLQMNLLLMVKLSLIKQHYQSQVLFQVVNKKLLY
eukprot:UN01262